ncbi:MAG: cytochrome C class I [Gammaproteobacteria bacterium]|nr:MAG: cytochrome C class I [Gammaproteobacteria bacterium]TND04994.1 MAG: cytochrome C class I [Gammaproteobacteria bacterium]
MKRLKLTIRSVAGAALFGIVLGGSVAIAADGEQLLTSQCAGCHNLTGPAPATLQALRDRKGPDLFYAGNKYKAAWVEQWLQKPQSIRPAGMFYGAHIKPGPKGDEIDAATLTQHPALKADEAQAVTAALMQRKAGSELIAPGAYTPGTISLSTGEMMFDKFRGCLACHEIEPGYGGRSGPEVYTAGARLQEDYLISYLRSPQAWDPKTFMPNKHLSGADLQKFVHYMRLLSEEGQP